MKRSIFFTLVLVAFILNSTAIADVPQMINYQGRLTDTIGEAIVDGNYIIKFTIYNAAVDGDELWTSGLREVPVSSGLFNYILGDSTAFPEGLFGSDSPTYLGIKIGGDNELPNRIILISVPYAMHSKLSDSSKIAATIPDHAITTDKIANGTILFEDIGQNGAANGQVMKWNGSTWTASPDDTGNGRGSNWSVVDSVLYTNAFWGLARGGAQNLMYGDSIHTMVNLGVSCSTGLCQGYGWNDYRYLTIGGGYGNAVGGYFNTVAGGKENKIMDWHSTIGGGNSNEMMGPGGTICGGISNISNGGWTTIGGGTNNFIAGGSCGVICGGDSNEIWAQYSVVGGGRKNKISGTYSVIPGGIGNTIGPSTNYSYLFGINSSLTEDSTFMVDMPHIRFGDEDDGYEFPAEDGTAGQVMATDGTGKLSWSDGPSPTPGFFPFPAYDSDWFYLSMGSQLSVNHNLGRDPNTYIVDLQFKKGNGISNHGIGSLQSGSQWWGVYYENLDSNGVRIKRMTNDPICDSIRVRIWIVQ